MKGLSAFFVITVLVAIVFFFLTGKVTAKTEQVGAKLKQRTEVEKGSKKDEWKPFTFVALVMFCRSIIGTSLNTFIPLVLIVIIGLPKSIGSLGLSLFALFGALGTFSGGYISDRIGRKKLVIICSCVASPLLFLFAVNNNAVFAYILIFLLAIFSSGPHSTLVVMGQEFISNRMGLASGIMFGLTVSIGGIVAPGIGRIGDVFGLHWAMLTLGFVSIIARGLVCLIPQAKVNKKSKPNK
jgi:FSR family fosmidomycin resistance protein-like MFS transporter